MRLVIHIDGGARGNPGEAGFGAHVAEPGGATLAELYGYLGTQTNNVAEYAALIAALTWAHAAGAVAVEIRSDSELLVRQMNGIYRVKNAGLIPMHAAARGLAARIGAVVYHHVRREQNREADALANRAMDTRSEDPPGVASGLPLPRGAGAA